MDTFAVIGLGRFGSRLAINLARAGAEVVAIDRRPEIIEDIRDRVTLAVAMDATDEQALRMQGIDRVDVAVVGIGDDFEAITLTTVLLKQLGVRRVISRATSHMLARILERIGADEVVNPEDESADRWAHRLINPHFLNQIEFHPGYSIVEVPAPKAWAGQSLVQLALRTKAGVHVVAIKRRREGDPVNFRIEMPTPTDPLRPDDIMILMGRDEHLARLPHD